ncbi:MAG TPA: serine/threonine-protein kinase [Polyangiaceae bacterium]|nr:serine/threonine-protein kinase [Polyangiaceae bacterium]
MVENTEPQFPEPEKAAEPAPAPPAKVCDKCRSRFSGDARFCPFDGEPLRAATAKERGPDPLLGTTIDLRYEIEGVLGEGGMGTVYRARHYVLDKKLALKVLRADLARDADLGTRFIREARAAAAVNHPNVVQITDFGTLPSGQPYFVMELLAGMSLSALVRRGGPLPAGRAVRLLLQMVDGLSAAHQAGVVHRDLKPDNIVVCPGPNDQETVKVLDFGLAKVAGQSRLTRAGLVFGTPHYMSPEQAMGGTVDERTDIYSLGIVMYEMFTGRVPFEADSFMGVLTKHLYVEPTPPSVLLGDTAKLGALEQVTLRCLEKKPEKRFASMAALGDELRRVTQWAEDGTFVVKPAELREPRAHRLADELELPSREELRMSLSRAGVPEGGLPAWAVPALALAAFFVVGATVTRFLSSGARDAPVPGAPAPSAVPAAAAVRAPRPSPPHVAPPSPSPVTGPSASAAAPEPPAPGKRPPRPKAPAVSHARDPAGNPVARPAPNPSTTKEKMIGGEIVDPWSR